MRTVDAAVIGLGPGGEQVATELARAGWSVLAVEEHLVGGECPYYGCVPSKMMVRAADVLAEGRRVNALAGSAQVHPSWAPVAARIRAEATDDWDDEVAVRRLIDAGAQFVRGRGSVAGPAQVRVTPAGAESELVAVRAAIVVATGTAPLVPDIPGLAGTPYWTNRDIVAVRDLPTSLIVLGGGAIGCEIAQVFARFGVDVTIVEALERILSVEEEETSALLAEAMSRDGVRIRTGAAAAAVRHDRTDGFTVTLSDESAVRGTALLVAIGRRTNVPGLGLHTVGLDPDARTVPVDEWCRAAPGVWAVGDITGHGAFTHVATYQADVVLRDLLDRGGPSADYSALPRVTFTDPEIGSVGLTRAQARERGLRIHTGSTQVASTARGWLHGPGNDGLIGLVVDADRGVLVGATSAGPAGGEVLGMLALAVHAQVPVEQLRSMIYAYPTFHRGVQDALRDLS